MATGTGPDIDDTKADSDDTKADNDDGGLPPYDSVAKQVFIKEVDGRVSTINKVPLSLTVSEFLELLRKQKGHDPDYTRLIFGGKQLDANKSESPNPAPSEEQLDWKRSGVLATCAEGLKPCVFRSEAV